MYGIEQSDALDRETLGPQDVARFWREPRLHDLECLTARFTRHRYALHSHDTFAIGVILAGAEAYRVGRTRQVAVAGQIVVVDPGEPHDGEPADGFYAYRMTYPSTELMRSVVADASGRPTASVPIFRKPLIDDPELFGHFLSMHVRMDRAPDRLARDEALAGTLALLVRRHAATGFEPPPVRGERDPVGRVCDFLDAHHAEDVDLETLATIAGCTRFHLIRSFRRTLGVTPHAWLVDRRVRTARTQLAAGDRPAEVATAAGFADQSHLTRAFKARTGVTPGVFRAAYGHV